MTFNYPGSIEVVSWRENLPEYIYFQDWKSDDELVVAEFGDSVGESLYRYDKHRVYREVVREVFERNPNFNVSDLQMSMEKAHERDENSFGVPVSDLEERL